MIVLRAEPSEQPHARTRKLSGKMHPAAGIWADREDIGDTVEFASQLRHHLETRRDARK